MDNPLIKFFNDKVKLNTNKHKNSLHRDFLTLCEIGKIYNRSYKAKIMLFKVEAGNIVSENIVNGNIVATGPS